MKRIEIDDDIHHYLVSKAVDIGESASSILRRELHLAPPASESIEIDDDVYSFLVSKMVSIGESASSILRRELHLAEHDDGEAGGGNQPGNPPPNQPGNPPANPPGNPPGNGPAIVEFRIPLGTVNNPWNTRDRAVVATVGDTLRIVNDDAVPHRLHTPGAPFPHPANDILPGQSAEFVLASPFDPALNGSLSDHLFGPSAQFWIQVRPAN